MVNIQYNQDGDNLESLPVDQQQPSENELEMINKLFKSNKSVIGKVAGEFKELVIVGILFLLFSSSLFDSTIKKLIPATENNQYIFIGVKLLLLMIFYWVIKNFGLIKSQ